MSTNEMDDKWSFCSLFWNEGVWLPPGRTWEELLASEHFHYPKYMDIWIYPCCFAAVFISLRYLVLNPFVFTAIGKYLNIKDVQPRAPLHNDRLETVFLMYNSKAPKEVVAQIAQMIHFTDRQVERWLRQRKASSRVSDLTKFKEWSFHLLYYSCYCIMGGVVMWDKPWLWDIRHCYYGFPDQSIDIDVWWYYMVAQGYYLGMSVNHFFHHHTKDSWQMFGHHVVTITLITLSWACNFVRIGTLVLIVHECADIPLILGKMCGLTGNKKLQEKVAIVFFLQWVSTRCIIFPMWIIRSGLFEAHIILDTMYPVYYIFNGLLLILFMFHLVWTYIILKIAVRQFTESKIADIRSESESAGSNEDDENDVGMMKKKD